MLESEAEILPDRDANVARASAIIEEYEQFIRTVIRCRTNDPDHIDDLFQSFFLSLVAHPPRHSKNIKSYIYHAISRDCIDAARKRNTYQLKIRRYAERCRHAREQPPPPEHRLMTAEEARTAFDLIDHLPDHMGDALKLRYMKDYENDEIAEELGVKNSSVRRYISVGLKKIRQLVDGPEERGEG